MANNNTLDNPFNIKPVSNPTLNTPDINRSDYRGIAGGEPSLTRTVNRPDLNLAQIVKQEGKRGIAAPIFNPNLSQQEYQQTWAADQGFFKYLGKGISNAGVSFGTSLLSMANIAALPIGGVASMAAGKGFWDGALVYQDAVNSLKEAITFDVFENFEDTQDFGIGRMTNASWWATTGADGVGMLGSFVLGYGAVGKAVSWGTSKALSASLGARLAANGVKNTIDIVGTSVAMGAVEAAMETYDLSKQLDEIYQQKVQQGLLLPEDAEDFKNAQMTSAFWSNMGVSTVSNIVFGQLLGGYLYNNKIVPKLFSGKHSSIQNALFENGSKLLKKSLSDVSKWKKAGIVAQRTLPGIAGEFVTEGLEEYTQTAIQSYLTGAAELAGLYPELTEEDKIDFVGSMNGIVKSWANAWALSEAQEAAFFGAFLSLLPGGVSVYKESGRTKKLLNDYYKMYSEGLSNFMPVFSDFVERDPETQEPIINPDGTLKLDPDKAGKTLFNTATALLGDIAISRANEQGNYDPQTKAFLTQIGGIAHVFMNSSKGRERFIANLEDQMTTLGFKMPGQKLPEGFQKMMEGYYDDIKTSYDKTKGKIGEIITPLLNKFNAIDQETGRIVFKEEIAETDEAKKKLALEKEAFARIKDEVILGYEKYYSVIDARQKYAERQLEEVGLEDKPGDSVIDKNNRERLRMEIDQLKAIKEQLFSKDFAEYSIKQYGEKPLTPYLNRFQTEAKENYNSFVKALKDKGHVTSVKNAAGEDVEMISSGVVIKDSDGEYYTISKPKEGQIAFNRLKPIGGSNTNTVTLDVITLNLKNAESILKIKDVLNPDNILTPEQGKAILLNQQIYDNNQAISNSIAQTIQESQTELQRNSLSLEETGKKIQQAQARLDELKKGKLSPKQMATQSKAIQKDLESFEKERATYREILRMLKSKILFLTSALEEVNALIEEQKQLDIERAETFQEFAPIIETATQQGLEYKYYIPKEIIQKLKDAKESNLQLFEQEDLNALVALETEYISIVRHLQKLINDSKQSLDLLQSQLLNKVAVSFLDPSGNLNALLFADTFKTIYETHKEKIDRLINNKPILDDPSRKAKLKGSPNAEALNLKIYNEELSKYNSNALEEVRNLLKPYYQEILDAFTSKKDLRKAITLDKSFTGQELSDLLASRKTFESQISGYQEQLQESNNRLKELAQDIAYEMSLLQKAKEESKQIWDSVFNKQPQQDLNNESQEESPELNNMVEDWYSIKKDNHYTTINGVWDEKTNTLRDNPNSLAFNDWVNTLRPEDTSKYELRVYSGPHVGEVLTDEQNAEKRSLIPRGARDLYGVVFDKKKGLPLIYNGRALFTGIAETSTYYQGDGDTTLRYTIEDVMANPNFREQDGKMYFTKSDESVEVYNIEDEANILKAYISFKEEEYNTWRNSLQAAVADGISALLTIENISNGVIKADKNTETGEWNFTSAKEGMGSKARVVINNANFIRRVENEMENAGETPFVTSDMITPFQEHMPYIVNESGIWARAKVNTLADNKHKENIVNTVLNILGYLGRRGYDFNTTFDFNGRQIRLFPKAGEPDLISLFINYKLNSQIDFANNKIDATTPLKAYQITTFTDEVGNVMVMYQPPQGPKEILRASDIVSVNVKTGNVSVNKENPQVKLLMDFIESKYHNVSIEGLLPNGALGRDSKGFKVPKGLNFTTKEVLLSADSYNSYEDYIMDTKTVTVSVRKEGDKPMIINRYFTFADKYGKAPVTKPKEEKKVETKPSQKGKTVTTVKTTTTKPVTISPKAPNKTVTTPTPAAAPAQEIQILDKASELQAVRFSTDLFNNLSIRSMEPNAPILSTVDNPVLAKDYLDKPVYVFMKNDGSAVDEWNYQFEMVIEEKVGRLQIKSIKSNPRYNNTFGQLIKSLNSTFADPESSEMEGVTVQDIVETLADFYNDPARKDRLTNDSTLTFYPTREEKAVGKVLFTGFMETERVEEIKGFIEDQAKEPKLKCV